jgi:DNA-3-methyladenine glycosylase I
MKRCKWIEGQFKEYVDYHDNEWGVPVHDDTVLFEFLTLEGAQAGLSWNTILKRREGYRECFDYYDLHKISNYDQIKIDRLILDDRIVRNELKINSVVKNAQCFLKIQNEYGSFDNYLWGFVNGETIIGNWNSHSQVPVITKESDTLSKDLKRRGFSFVGSTIMYAYMQACGLVNDHTVDCFRYLELRKI